MFDERLIDRCFDRLLGSSIQVSLDGLNILIRRLPFPWFLYICWVDVLFIVIKVILVCGLPIRLKGNIVILWNMRNRVSFCVKLSLACLIISLGVFLLILPIKTFLIAKADFLRNMNLSIWFGLQMLAALIDPGAIEGILISFSVVSYWWTTVIAFGFEDHIPISIDILNRLLPVIVGLRIVIFSDEDDCIVQWRWRLREEKS